MAWTYLAELEESASHLENGSDLSPTVKLIHTPVVCSYHEWPTEIYGRRLYGMTLPHWMDQNSYRKLMLSTQDFHAKTLALLDLEKAWKESEADCFMRSSGLLARLSLDSSSWRMYQPLLHEGERKWSGNLPRWGMTVDGALYQLRRLEQYTCVKGGSYLPTLNMTDWKRGDAISERSRKSPDLPAKLNMAYGTKGKKIHPHFLEKMMLYPIGWTELKPWAIPSFRLNVKKRLKF